MHGLAHASYPFMAANIVAYAIGKPLSLELSLWIILFSLIPDFDYGVDFLQKKLRGEKYTIPPFHHAWPSHWPIVYTPLIFASIIWPAPYVIAATASIYMHLFMDMFFCSEGIMLLYPVSKRWYNFFAGRTQAKPGMLWNRAYNLLKVFRVVKLHAMDKICFAITLLMVANRIWIVV